MPQSCGYEEFDDPKYDRYFPSRRGSIRWICFEKKIVENIWAREQLRNGFIVPPWEKRDTSKSVEERIGNLQTVVNNVFEDKQKQIGEGNA